MELLIFWGICGLIAMAIYQSKGRSGAVGCLGGFLLGPIGVLLALVSGTDERSKERKAVRSGRMKKCPACAELIQAEAHVCRYCGHPQP